MLSEESTKAPLGRDLILRGRDRFTAVFEQGSGVRSSLLLAKYLARPSEKTRIVAGFIVRRSAGNAVRRNRIRRLLREAYRLERPGFESNIAGPSGIEIAFLWLGRQGDPPRPTLEEIRSEVRRALSRISKKLRDIG